jgi:hypothetical protein
VSEFKIYSLRNYLSDAPQAEPHAAGASAGLSDAPHAAGASAGLSEAPHAEPQAAGFSAGLSDAPHAVPQADTTASSAILFHPDKFESAIINDLLMYIQRAFLPSVIIIIPIFLPAASTHFFVT